MTDRRHRPGARTGGVAALLAAALVLLAACTAPDPTAADPAIPGTPVSVQGGCATERSREERGDASTVPLADVLVREPPEGYEPGAERALSTDEFIDDTVAGGEENERHFRELFAAGANGIYERSFVPEEADVDPGLLLMTDRTVGYGVIYAFVVCFDTVEAATAYALDGAQEPPPNGTVVSLPATDGRLTTVRDDHAVAGLLRSGRAVITFGQWVDDGNVTVDLAAIDDLVVREVDLVGSAPGT